MHLGKNVSPSAACLLLPTRFLIFHLKTGTQTGNPAAPTVPHECGTRRKFTQSLRQKERRHRRGKRSLMRSLLAGIDLHCLPAPNLSVSLVFYRAECVVFETVWIPRNTFFPLNVWNSEEDYSLHRHDEGLSRPVPIYLSFLPGRKAILHRSLTPLMLLLFETAIPEGLHKK